MGSRQRKQVFEPDLIAPYRAVRIELSEHHPQSSKERGALLRWYLSECEKRLGQPLGVDLINWFFPDMAQRCGVDAEWSMRRIDSLRAGRGCSQRTFARLVPLLVRLPQFGRPTWFPAELHRFECIIFPGIKGGAPVIRRMDGTTLPMPPDLTKHKREAA